MAEIGCGYSWFKFDVNGWLTSPDVNEMSYHEQGVYIKLLAIQWRDGQLMAGMSALHTQTGVDVRVLKKWFKKWGYLFPIIQIVETAELKHMEQPCGKCSAHGLQSCDNCVTTWSQLCYNPAASWMQLCYNPAATLLQLCRKRVNPKLWNLSVESGKFAGQPFLEENRIEEILDIDIDLDHTKTRMILKGNSIARKFGV